jgi:hypothetical protein
MLTLFATNKAMTNQLHLANQGARNGGTDVHLTPYWVVNIIPHVLGSYYLDPCACELRRHHTGAKVTLTKGEDGLSQPWLWPAFVNPPFSDTRAWIDKALDSQKPVLMLTKFDARVKWFDHLINAAPGKMSFVVKGYTKFLQASTDEQGHLLLTEGGSAMFQTCLTVLNSPQAQANLANLHHERLYKLYA